MEGPRKSPTLSRSGPRRAALAEGERARSPARPLAQADFAEPLLQPGDKQLDFRDIGRRQRRARPAQGGRGDRAALGENVFSDGEADALLLLVASQGQIGVKD